MNFARCRSKRKFNKEDVRTPATTPWNGGGGANNAAKPEQPEILEQINDWAGIAKALDCKADDVIDMSELIFLCEFIDRQRAEEAEEEDEEEEEEDDDDFIWKRVENHRTSTVVTVNGGKQTTVSSSMHTSLMTARREHLSVSDLHFVSQLRLDSNMTPSTRTTTLTGGATKMARAPSSRRMLPRVSEMCLEEAFKGIIEDDGPKNTQNTNDQRSLDSQGYSQATTTSSEEESAGGDFWGDVEF